MGNIIYRNDNQSLHILGITVWAWMVGNKGMEYKTKENRTNIFRERERIDKCPGIAKYRVYLGA